MTTLLEKVSRLNEIGIALSVEHNSRILLEKILFNAKFLTNADGASIYSILPEKKIRFEIVTTDSLGYHQGGTSAKPVKLPDIILFEDDGAPNEKNIVACAVNTKKSINIEDAYEAEGFDFSGTRAFDQSTGYRTKAVLTIPILNHLNEVVAALQLINPIDPATQAIIPFTKEDQQLTESLASQAGVALTNQRLIQNLRELFDSLIRALAVAIDEKSPSTGNHGKRVPIIAAMLAEVVDETHEGPLKDVHFTDDEFYELQVAAFLHDCGKIVTPVHIVEKKSKLETIYDRVEWINTRIELQKLEAKIALLEKKISEESYHEEIEELEAQKGLIDRCNRGQEPITKEVEAKIRSLNYLTPDEKECLLIPKGNLTEKERKIIQHHVEMTQRMLTQLIFPKNLSQVPEIAGSHHEKLGGTGYPRGLKGDEMSLRARILAISDVFEALSAPDRSYKKALPLSEIYQIMQKMVDAGEMDPDLFALFRQQKVGEEYAKRHCSPAQLDQI